MLASASRRDARALTALACGLALACVVVVVARLGTERRPWSRDETDLTSLAFAMARDGWVWLRPTYHPRFDELGHVAVSRVRLGDGLVAPPLASALMALPAIMGWTSTSAWPLAGGVLFVGGLASLIESLASEGRRPLPRAASLAAAVLVLCLAPRAIIDALTLEAEVPLAGFACLALAAASRAPVATRASTIGARAARARPWLAGAFVGLAFLSKLWLAGPCALAVLGALVGRRAPRREVAAYLVSASLVASTHLAIVALLDPASLGRWLREVYLGGILSTKMSGVAAHPEWNHGPWYYPAAIARELGASLLLAWVGARRASPSARVAALGMIAGVAVLSVPSVKEPLYVLPAIALGLAFAGRGLLVLIAHAAGDGRGARVARLAVAVVACGALVVSARVSRPPDAPDDGRMTAAFAAR